MFSAAVLEGLERDLHANILDHFDLVAGTSTGGLIALALGAGLSTTQIVDFYTSRGPRDLPGTGASTAAAAQQARPGAARRGAGGGARRATALAEPLPVVDPSNSLDAGDVYLFKTPHHPRLRRDYRERMLDVAMATTAAPTYLPAFGLGNNRLVDGGVWANNPALIAVAEATSMLGATPHQVRMLSLGTTDEVIDRGKGLTRGGLVQLGGSVRNPV